MLSFSFLWQFRLAKQLSRCRASTLISGGCSAASQEMRCLQLPGQDQKMGRKQEVMGLEWKKHSCLAPASVITGAQLLQKMGKYILVFYYPWVVIQHSIFTIPCFKNISSSSEFLKSTVKQILCLKEAVLASTMCLEVWDSTGFKMYPYFLTLEPGHVVNHATWIRETLEETFTRCVLHIQMPIKLYCL